MPFNHRRSSLWFVLSLCLVLSACAGKKKEDPKPQGGNTNPPANTQQTGGTNGATPAGQLPTVPLLPPGAAQTSQPNPRQLPPALTPQQRLEDLTVAPPPIQQDAKPGLQRVLWLSLQGDGDRSKHENDPVAKENHLKADIHIVQTPTLVPENTHPPTGRFISGPVTIMDHDGRTTKGHFEFRHPSRGVIEDFHAESDSAKRSLEQITQAQNKVPQPFAIEIKIPLDKVTVDMVLVLDRAYHDLADRNAELARKPDDENVKRKQHQAFNRLDIQKALIIRDLLNPAFQPWVDDFTCEPGKTPDNSGCMSEQDRFDLKLEDQKAFMKFLDVPENLEKLREEFRTVTRNQALYEQDLRAMGPSDAVPPLPPPPKSDDAIVNAASEPVILETDGLAKASLAQPNRIKVAFIAEGFTKDQSAKFYAEAQAKWDYLMGGGKTQEAGVEPFKSYKSYFVGVAIFVASNQEGSCHPSKGTPCPDTAFKSSYDTGGMERLLSIPVASNEKMKKLLMAKLPDAKLAAFLVNDLAYGGAGGPYALASIHNPMGGETLAHELMGHTFAHLGDEYEADYSSYPNKEEPNTTMDDKGTKADAWRATMKEASSKMPANWDLDLLSNPVIEGAHYHRTGWWRPLRMCKMRALGVTRLFCPVCTETIIREIYGKVNVVDKVTYSAEVKVKTGEFEYQGTKLNGETQLEAKAGEAWTIELKTLMPRFPAQPGEVASTNPIEIKWFITGKDGQERELATGPTLEGTKLVAFDKGDYTLIARTKDVNPTVFSTLGQIRPWKLKLKK